MYLSLQLRYGVFMRWFRISAHRGAPSSAPENTIPGFVIAMGLDVDFIEFDVRASRDGVLVVIHDEYVDRTTNGHGRVSDKYFLELRRLDAGSWFSEDFRGIRIPTLREVLGLLSSCKGEILVDVKVEGYEKEILGMIYEFDVQDKVWIASDNWSILSKVRDMESEIPLMGITYKLNGEALRYAKKLNISMLAPRLKDITEENIRLCEKYGILINAGIINDPETACRYANMGVDTISTDNPKLLVSYRNKASPIHL